MEQEIPETPPSILDPEPHELTVTVHWVEGIHFATEIGAQQVQVSILFPSHQTDQVSAFVAPSQKVSFEYSQTFQLKFYPNTTINALLSSPLEFYLYVGPPDLKKPAVQIARFVFPFDQLFFNASSCATVEGTVLQEGNQAVLSPGVKANIECSWDKPLFTPEECENSIIATMIISNVNSIPQPLINCVSTPGNPATHIFTYSLYCQLPNNKILLFEDGKFQSTQPEASDAIISFGASQKFFISPEDLEAWKAAADAEENIKIYLIPDVNSLLQPLGITPDQYAALFARSDLPTSDFTRPGRSHYLGSVPLFRDSSIATIDRPIPPHSPTGFPPEPVVENALKKKAVQRKPAQPSSRNAKQRAPPSGQANKRPKGLNAKDKKTLTTIQAAFNFDPETDYFKDSNAQLKIEIALSKPIIPRQATPASKKTPEEIVKPLPKLHHEKLADATHEFQRQLTLAMDRLEQQYNADPETPLDNLKGVIKEQLKPSIVQIVKQVFLASHDNPETEVLSSSARAAKEAGVQVQKEEEKKPEAQSFISELQTFLIAHLHKTLNNKFDLAYPRPPVHNKGMDVPLITARLASQSFHHTDNIEQLHLERCRLDPLNAKWAYELALYYSDIGSDNALNYFARAISIDYGFIGAILGFCAALAKTGNRTDPIVLLNKLNDENPGDPTIVVCLSILNTLIESSKADEYSSQISAMTASLQKSPLLIGAASLLEVHDTYMSEIILQKEQQNAGRSKELLVLLARLSQQISEYSRAQEYLKEAIEKDHEDLGLWKTLGEYQYSAGEFDKAKQSFETLLSLSNEPDPEICLRLAIIEIRHKKYELAYDLLMYCVQKKEFTLAWTCLGICCLRLDNFEEANAALTEANSMDKYDATIWGYCAVLCAKMERWVEGEQSLVIAQKLKLKDYRLIREIIQLYEEKAQGEETLVCIQEFEKVKEEDCHQSLESDDNFSEVNNDSDELTVP